MWWRTEGNVHHRSALLRRFRDSGAGYKTAHLGYTYLRTFYLLPMLQLCSRPCLLCLVTTSGSGSCDSVCIGVTIAVILVVVIVVVAVLVYVAWKRGYLSSLHVPSVLQPVVHSEYIAASSGRSHSVDTLNTTVIQVTSNYDDNDGYCRPESILPHGPGDHSPPVYLTMDGAKKPPDEWREWSRSLMTSFSFSRDVACTCRAGFRYVQWVPKWRDRNISRNLL